MRIAVYHNLPSGGGKRALFEMTRRLAQKHTIEAYSLSCAEHSFGDIRPFCVSHQVSKFEALPLARSPFGRLNPIIRMIDLLRLKSLNKKIAKQIDLSQPDLVFVHNCQFHQTPALLQFLQTPTIYCCGEPPRALYEPNILRSNTADHRRVKFRNLLDKIDPLPELYKRVLKAIDAKGMLSAKLVLTNSAFSRETLYRIYEVNARICYLGIDVEKFRPCGYNKENLIISVGALTSKKGFEDVIEAVGQIRQSIRPAVLIITNYPEPGEKQYLERLAASNKVTLTIKANVTDNELVTWYNKALLTVYLPVLEPFGFVPLESMACGTPVIGVREGGVRESVLDGINGFLVDRDKEEIARKIEAFIEKKEEISHMPAAGQEIVRKSWTWENTLEYLEKSFAKVLN